MKINSIYLPPEGKYQPTPVPGTTQFGYPWQHNPMVHKSASEPQFCRSRHVFRRYIDNLVVYTRTSQQLADGLYAYYLYDEQSRLVEIGEVALPLTITDDNWHLYKYENYAEQTAFIRSLGGRTNVMLATYHNARSTVHGASLPYYPVSTITCYQLVEADTIFNADHGYITTNGYERYSFTVQEERSVEVTIQVTNPVAEQLPTPALPIFSDEAGTQHQAMLTNKENAGSHLHTRILASLNPINPNLDNHSRISSSFHWRGSSAGRPVSTDYKQFATAFLHWPGSIGSTPLSPSHLINPYSDNRIPSSFHPTNLNINNYTLTIPTLANSPPVLYF